MALTKLDANKIVAQVMMAFLELDADIKIIPSDQYGNSPGGFVLAWEEGPTDWPRLFCDLVFDEARPTVTAPSYMFLEPVNTGVLGIYES